MTTTEQVSSAAVTVRRVEAGPTDRWCRTPIRGTGSPCARPISRRTGWHEAQGEENTVTRRDGDTHAVRPRWTWIALLVMVTGLVLIAVGIIVQSWAWAVPGLVVLAVGAAIALYGGFFYNVQGGASAGAQLKDVVEDNVHEFPGAGTVRPEDEVKRDVRRRWLRDR